MIGGLAGAVAAIVAVLALWQLGALPAGRDRSADLEQRLNSIGKQVSDLAAKPAPASVDPKILEDISARLGRLESAQAAPRAPVTDPVVLGRLGATENAIKSVADNVTAISRRTDSIDASLREVNNRFDKMTTLLTEVQSTARSAASGSDRASRFALAVSALRGAVERGDPFTAELALVKTLAPEGATTAAMEPFAASGVPSAAALGKELATIVQSIPRDTANTATRKQGLLDRIQASAEKLVRIRRADEAPGDDRDAILTRIEQLALHGDLAGASKEIAKLPEGARGAAQPAIQNWETKVSARNKAIEASRRLAADAVTALKATP